MSMQRLTRTQIRWIIFALQHERQQLQRTVSNPETPDFERSLANHHEGNLKTAENILSAAYASIKSSRIAIDG